MNISIDKIIHRYTNTLPQVKADNKAAQKETSGKNFDEVMIQSNSQQIEERKLAESLTKKVMSGISESVPEDRLEALRNAVSEGMYQIDADAIASKLLFEKGE